MCLPVSAQCYISYRSARFTSHLICTVLNQMTGFYMKCNTGLECVNVNNRENMAL